MSDNITLPRELAEEVLEALIEARALLYDGRKQDKAATALRAALAAPRPEPSGYAYRYADNVLRFNDGGWLSGWPPVEAVPYWFAPPALAAEQPKHPGYVIGSHWLETAYSRICAGEAEADVLRDCGWERVDEALRRDAERWKHHRSELAASLGMPRELVDAIIDAAIGDKT
jgi:hypothetical protein